MPISTPSIIRILLFTIAATFFFHLVFGPDPPEGKDTLRNFRRPKFGKKPPPQVDKMSSTYVKDLAVRRSVYALEKKSPISNARIQEIVAEAIKHTPSAFNSQAGRAVILYGADHEKLWQFGDEAAKAALPPPAYEGLKAKIAAFGTAYGTVMFFEDKEVLDAAKQRTPGMPFDQWSEHSSGMLQTNVWTAFALEGLGANLQHYNMMKGLQEKIKEHFGLSMAWDLKSQLVFGTPAGPPREKAFEPIDGKRLIVIGA